MHPKGVGTLVQKERRTGKRGLILTVAALAVLAFVEQSEGSPVLRYGPEYQTCNRKPTVEIVTCVQDHTKVWDTRLNAAYKELQALLPDRRKTLLRDAQRLWIKYRDANCEYYYSREGSLRQIETAECLRAMTATRALELEAELRP